MARGAWAWVGILLLAASSVGVRVAAGQASLQPQAQAAQRVGTFRVSGHVVDALTKAPVARVTVTIPLGGDATQVVRTGTDGAFSFEQLPAGRYIVWGRRKGYANQMYLQHERYTAGVAVGPDLDSENLVFPLWPAGEIAGTVTDEAGEVVRSASVTLVRDGAEEGKRGKELAGMKFTDDEGAFRFADLRNGDYYVAVSATPWYSAYETGARNMVLSAEGAEQVEQEASRNPELDMVYPITYYPNATDASGAQAIHVTPGSRAQANLVLTPVPALHIRVRVEQTNGQRMVAVSSSQSVMGVRDENYSVSGGLRKQVSPETSGGSGQLKTVTVAMGGLRPGATQLEIYDFGERADAASTGPPRTRRLTIDPAEGQTLDLAALPQAPVVRGTVQVAGGAPVPEGARVTLRDTSSSKMWATAARADGTFTVQNAVLTPGATYRVYAGAAGMGLQSIVATGAKVLPGRKIQIGDAGDVQLELTLAKDVNGRVKGTAVRAADGKPAVGMMAVLVPENLADIVEYRRDETNTDGSFAWAGVSPGRYTLVALADWEIEWGRPEVIREYLKGGATVVVTAGGENDVKVTVAHATPDRTPETNATTDEHR